MQFIKNLIRDGIRDRHFLDASKINGPGNVAPITDVINAIINKEKIGVMDPSGKITSYKYWGHIAECDGIVAGMCLCKTVDYKESRNPFKQVNYYNMSLRAFASLSTAI